ncbi:MAG: hypothetical protein ABMA64_25850 [Myxococcota bacterium]
MTLTWWLATTSWSAEGAPECALDSLDPPPQQLSVAWVSPLRKRARNTAWLYVVPTRDLRAFAEGEGKGDPVRTLQWLGLRRSDRPPGRRYKVVIFDVASEHLCRPVVAAGEVGGVVACDADHAGPDGRYEGCGTATDTRTGRASIAVYRAQWQALASDGFCLLPLERFLAPAP